MLILPVWDTARTLHSTPLSKMTAACRYADLGAREWKDTTTHKDDTPSPPPLPQDGSAQQAGLRDRKAKPH